VYGVDFVPERLAMAEWHGVEVVNAADTDDVAEALRTGAHGRATSAWPTPSRPTSPSPTTTRGGPRALWAGRSPCSKEIPGRSSIDHDELARDGQPFVVAPRGPWEVRFRQEGYAPGMSSGAWLMLVAIAIAVGTLGLLIVTLVRSILVERSQHRSMWREFGLGLILITLFLTTWLAQGISQWQSFTDEQHAHGESAEVGDFVSDFAHSTFENWQSEFLQLFSFVVLAALYIHKGSAESKDSDEKIEAALRRIEERLGTLPDTAPGAPEEAWKLPETPLEVHDQTAGAGASRPAAPPEPAPFA
jgi:hypothetical protein